jgi:hypothetical protein
MNLMTLLVALGLATSTTLVAPKMPLDSTEAIKAEIVTVFGKDSEIMTQVAFCESTLVHSKNGEVTTGIENKSDKGLFQINLFYWEEIAKKKGIDIHSLKGNIRMAKYIFDTQGLQAWVSSSKCWKHALNE